jgi:hypothetical protein
MGCGHILGRGRDFAKLTRAGQGHAAKMGFGHIGPRNGWGNKELPKNHGRIRVAAKQAKIFDPST